MRNKLAKFERKWTGGSETTAPPLNDIIQNRLKLLKDVNNKMIFDTWNIKYIIAGMG